MSRILALTFTFFGLVFVSRASASFIVLDNFTSPAVAQTAIIGPQPNPSVITTLTGLGSTRTSTFTVSSTPLGNFDLLAQQGAGNLVFNSGTGIRATAGLNYSNFTGGSNNFLSGGTPFRFLLDFTNIDPGQIVGGGQALTMPVDISISTANGTLNGSFLLNSTSIPQTYALPLTAFSGATIQDLSNVISVDVTFNNGANQRQAVDFVLTGVRIESDAVPLPPTALLGLASVPLLRLIRRRQIR